MSIPQSFLDELRQRTTLSQLLMRDITLKRAGREWKGCCPFHNEKTPSFYVNDEKEFYWCFGCEAHGDAIRWMTDHRGMQFIDAVKELAAAAGMEVPAQDPQAAQRAKAREGLVDINAQAERYFAANLTANREATEYLAGRGIPPTIAKAFNMGFAPRTRMADGAHLMKELKASPDALEALGLIRKRPDGDSYYDFFRGRIIIPIHDARGLTIGFGGRILGQGDPKYLNSPDTPVFDKGRTLFNLHRAAGPARAASNLIIVEGYMDVIALAGVDIPYAVAPNGTAITEAQLHLAWRLVDAPILLLDGDNAGRKAAVRAAKKALPELVAGKSLRFTSPPDGMDPDDVARADGKAGIERLTSDTLSIVDILWRDVTENDDISDPDGRARITRNIADMMQTIKDRDVYMASRTAFYDRLQGPNGRSAPARRAAPSMGKDKIKESVHSSLVAGLVRFPKICAEHDLTNMPWAAQFHRQVVEEITDVALDWMEFPRNGKIEAAVTVALDRAGLMQAFDQMKSEIHLRMPFLDEKNNDLAKMQLLAALRETFQ